MRFTTITLEVRALLKRIKTSAFITAFDVEKLPNWSKKKHKSKSNSMLMDFFLIFFLLNILEARKVLHMRGMLYKVLEWCKYLTTLDKISTWSGTLDEKSSMSVVSTSGAGEVEESRLNFKGSTFPSFTAFPSTISSSIDSSGWISLWLTVDSSLNLLKLSLSSSSASEGGSSELVPSRCRFWNYVNHT